MVYKILVCDDNEQCRNDIEYYAKEAANTVGVEAEIFTCVSGEECLNYVKQEEIHLLLLDVDMPDMSGLEVARKLREEQSNLVIVFVSSYPQYVFASFEVEAFRFVTKDKMKIELFLALRAAIPKINDQINTKLILNIDHREICMETSEIIYIEVLNRKLMIYLNDGMEYVVNMTMKELKQQLDEVFFVEIYNGLLVNIRYVRDIGRQEMILKNGTKLIIARTRAKDVKKKIMEYWSRL